MSALVSQATLDALIAALRKRYGLNFAPDRLHGAQSALQRLLSRSQSNSDGQIEFNLPDDDQILAELVSKMTVAETYFFRFPEQFDFIAQTVLPETLARTEKKNTPCMLKLWSAGCASGEEAYSLAMLLRSMGLLGNSEIYATDISSESLKKAELGLYGKWSFRDQGWQRAARYLSNYKGFQRVNEEISRAVHFKIHNLAAVSATNYAHPLINMDVILCRNVLIYLAPEIARQVVVALLHSLRPGGYLIFAPVDPVPAELRADYLQIPGVGLVLRKPSANAVEPVASVAEFSSLALAGTPRPQVRAVQTRSTRDHNKPKAQPGTPSVTNQQQLALLLQSGRNAEALTLCRELLATDIENIEARYIEAMLLLSEKQYQPARESLRMLLYLDPLMSEAHYALSVTLVKLGEVDAAQRAMETANRLSSIGTTSCAKKRKSARSGAGISKTVGHNAIRNTLLHPESER